MGVSALLAFALALAVMAGSPGPSVAALVARVLTNGFRDVLPFLAAMWIGEALWLTLAVAGMAVVAQAFGAFFIALKILGAVYLLFLAWKMWFAPIETAGGRPIPTGQRPWRMFAAGLLVTLGNPKIMVFYLALLPAILNLDEVGFVAWSELIVTVFVVLAAVDLSWAFLAMRAKRLLTHRRAVRIANRTSAAMMAGAALAVATR
jgi:threonine/homoserine/homoserine lactone efflux protein